MTTNLPEQKQSTTTERFVNRVMAEFQSFTGSVARFDEEKKRLAQHLFIKADSALKEFEAKRLQKNEKKSPFTWENVNLQKMAIDAIDRIELGLDALADNHIHVIPYFNTKLGKYDLDMRIGYIGKDYYKRRFAIDPPKDIIYELVYSNDKFGIIKRDFKNRVERYKFEVVEPFNRGKIVGGFGYLVYEDETKNRVIVVGEADFLKSMKLAGTGTFWSNHPEMMRMKTLVNRVTKQIYIDPQKVADLAVPESVYRVESSDDKPAQIEHETETIDAEFSDVTGEAAGDVTDQVTDQATDQAEKKIIDDDIPY
jgi:recombination protein RecT